jgi:hypothetical protein
MSAGHSIDAKSEIGNQCFPSGVSQSAPFSAFLTPYHMQNSAFGIPSPRPAPPSKAEPKRKRLAKRGSEDQGPRQGSMSSNVSASFSSIKSFDSTCSVPHPTVADSREAAFNFIRSDPRFHNIPLEHYIDPTQIYIAQGGEGAHSSIIGEGGQGTIFRATVTPLGSNSVAVKVSQSQSVMEEYATALKFDHKSSFLISFSSDSLRPADSVIFFQIF